MVRSTSLKSDFPDLSITKVRYLEDRGCWLRAALQGRYRKYSAADIRRLRTILTLQRESTCPWRSSARGSRARSIRGARPAAAGVRTPGSGAQSRSVRTPCIHRKRSAKTGVDADFPADAHRVPADRPQGPASGSGLHRERPGDGAHLPSARSFRSGASQSPPARLVRRARGGARGAGRDPVAALDARRQARIRREDGGGPGRAVVPADAAACSTRSCASCSRAPVRVRALYRARALSHQS